MKLSPSDVRFIKGVALVVLGVLAVVGALAVLQFGQMLDGHDVDGTELADDERVPGGSLGPLQRE